MTTKPTKKNSSPKPQSPVATRRFEGKVAVITGASVRGIGGAIAKRLSDEGASLALLSRSTPDALIEQLRAQSTNVVWNACDITDGDSIADATEVCIREFGEIDVLVNNAGIQSAGPFVEMDEKDWRRVVEVNLLGALKMSQTLLPHLQRKKGVIVNVSSATALAGTSGLAAYGAAKAGLNGLTETLAVEVAPQKVRVVGVAPALVRTPMVLPCLEHVAAEDWEAIQKSHPLGIGTPEDVAAAVAFLASSEARWISGVTLPLGWMPIWPLPPLKS